MSSNQSPDPGFVQIACLVSFVIAAVICAVQLGLNPANRSAWMAFYALAVLIFTVSQVRK